MGPGSLFRLAVFIFLPLVQGQSTDNGIYTVVAPKTIRPNSRYNVGVSVESRDPVKVLVYLTATVNSRVASTSNEERVIEPGTSSMITLAVGDLINGATYNLTVQGTDGIRFQNSTELSTNSKLASILIQTDKPIYKPGELVQYRVLLLDRTLRPYGPGPLDILIKDSQGNIIKKWGGAIAQRGLFSSQLQLSSEPNLGDWSIEVDFKGQKETHPFTIAEYVLPKFNVEIELPTFATFNESKIVARIRANYVYGKPLRGDVVVAAYPTIHSSYIQPVFTGISRKTVPIDGVVDVEFDLSKELGLTDDYQRLVNVEATVKESYTGRMQNASKTITLHKYSYKVEIIKGEQSFKPGLPYSVTIKVATQDDVPVRDSNPRALQIKHGFSYNHEEYESKLYAIPPNGLVTLTFDSPKNESINALGMEATYKDLTEWFPTVQRALSPSNTYLQARVISKNLRVNEEVEVEVESTTPFSSLNYQVLGRGDLILARVQSFPSPVSKTTIRLRIPPLASPQATLITYIVHENEVVADSVEFEVGGGIENFLNLTLTKETEPGKEVEILLTAKPNSLIGLKGIDQSVLLLKEDKDLSVNSLEKELNSWNFEKEARYRFKRSLFSHIGSSTSAQVFEDAGVVIMTNAVVHHQPPADFTEDTVANSRPVRPYYTFPLENSSLRPDLGPAIPYLVRTRPPLAGPYAFSRIPKSKLKFPRIFFSSTKFVPASTWIFTNTSTGYDGRASIRRQVPDTITSWILSGFSLDSTYGLGVTETPQKLRVFRPFFISLNTPYSVVKGEIVGIQVLVHNYLGRDVTAEVTLENGSNQFAFATDENEIEKSKLELFKTERVAVKSNSVASISFLITPTTLGPVDLKVKAVSRIAGDSIVRPLLVRPPGQVQKVNKAALIDLRAGRPYTVNLTTRFPPRRVPDSDSVKVSVVADILGPAISNLDKLLEMPTGCGEQNMIHFVPDIVILEYLQTTRQINEPLREKAVKFLETGYQRELSYKHDDGSFSAFGKADSSGSTFLTAFVARSFIAAKKHIFIEKDIIEKALNWLISKQNKDGSFPEVGKVFDSDIQGGSSSGPAALTAFVTLALVEAEADRDLPIVSNGKFSLAKNLAMDYLVKELQGLEDPYALSIIAYVLQLSNHPFRENAFNIMEGHAKLSDDAEQKHWERPKTAIDEKNPWTNTPKPVAVEATSYALLTYAQRNLIADALPLVRWLLAQRNEKGGFISTQDTVVGLTALAKFAAVTKSGVTDMNLEITHAGGTHNIRVNQNNAIVLEEIKLPPTTTWVNINAAGNGIGLVQVSWSYNVDVAGPWPLFNIDPQVDKTSNSNQLHLSICTHSTEEESNMAVMEVNVPTGYALNTDRLTNLLHYPQIKRFDTEDSDSKLVVYFDSLNKSEVCPTVSAYRVYRVARQAPTYVSVYDYYDNSRRARQFYSPPPTKICDICEEAQCSEECRVARLAAEAERNDGPSDISSAIMLTSPASLILVTLTLARLLFT